MYGVQIAFKDFPQASALRTALGSGSGISAIFSRLLLLAHRPQYAAAQLVQHRLQLSRFDRAGAAAERAEKPAFQADGAVDHVFAAFHFARRRRWHDGRFLSADGLVNQIIAAFGLEPFLFLQEPKWFRFLYVSSGIWQEVG